MEAFEALKDQPRVWFPIIVLVVAYTAVNFAYLYSVDLPWFMDAQMQAAGNQLTEAQREQAAARASNVSPAVYAAIGSVSTSGFVLLVMFLTALYYTGVSFMAHDGIKLKQWFALVAWCTLPTVLGAVAQVVNILATDSRFMLQDEINPLSFGNLLSIDRTGASIVQRILLGIDLTAIWGIVLTVLGYQAWTNSSLVKAVAVVLGPLALIVVISTLLTMT
jgi:hypothetical protein